jgi:hypothetical protein
MWCVFEAHIALCRVVAVVRELDDVLRRIERVREIRVEEREGAARGKRHS